MSETNIPENLDSEHGQSPQFKQTRWSLVRRAAGFDSPESREALEVLCRMYCFPIYAFIRRHGHSRHDAQDFTQEFFARLLASNSFARADPRLGKFRTFLLGALKHFLSDAQRKADSWKRGGGVEIISLDEAQAEERYQAELVDDRTPDKLFADRWAVVLLEAAIARLKEEFRAAGKERQFEVLKPFLSSDGGQEAYEQAATTLNSSAKSVAVAVHRLRRRFRHVLRSQIADTVGTPDEVDEEYRSLFS
jgi:RNA polymerase sigma-70 factor (ECF subfamily)